MPSSSPRTRDPERKGKILLAATELIGTHGFGSVSMTDIGQRAGITGSGIYRHFDSKATILVHLFEQTIDDLLAGEEAVVAAGRPPARALRELVDGQVSFVVDQRELARVYYHELQSLPEDDRDRLRRKQRRYVDVWVGLLGEARTDVTPTEARTVVYAAIGAIQSPLFHRVELDREVLRDHLAHAALAVLGLPRRRKTATPLN